MTSSISSSQKYFCAPLLGFPRVWRKSGIETGTSIWRNEKRASLLSCAFEIKLIDEILNLSAKGGGMPIWNHEAQIVIAVDEQIETTFTT